MKRTNRFKILFASAEVAPFAKTGGLADVAGSLPRYLSALGNDVRIVMPLYKTIDGDEYKIKPISEFPITMGDTEKTCIVNEYEYGFGKAPSRSLPVYFIGNSHYFDRQGIYGHHDDDERFAFFCKAILDMLPHINFQPDIIHLNDWHTGPVCMLLNEKYCSDPYFTGTGTIFTVHNLQYQGIFPKSSLNHFEMPDSVFTPDKVEFFGSFSYIKAGLCYADIINTVSSVYAEEIKTPEYGAGLDGLLRKRSDDLYGIANGIDCAILDPVSDIDIYLNYSVDNAVFGKSSNKAELQKELGLPVRQVPLIGLISRLTGQKGLDLILDAFDRLMEYDLQFILLGTGDEYYENAFKTYLEKYSDRFGLFIGFNPILASRIYAGSDLFLMPSSFEPCGLGQLISLRYGTIPVVRATGGLKETISDYTSCPDSGNGFSFNDYSSDSMMDAISRGLAVYSSNPEVWERLVIRAMNQDFSWNRSAERYMELYAKIRSRKIQ